MVLLNWQYNILTWFDKLPFIVNYTSHYTKRWWWLIIALIAGDKLINSTRVLLLYNVNKSWLINLSSQLLPVPWKRHRRAGSFFLINDRKTNNDKCILMNERGRELVLWRQEDMESSYLYYVMLVGGA